ncbi:hypothetical protein [Streptomyces lavendulocolor]|uniref:hypothetical protein n=1 Tax=Streptomyces lavendulocolor TaxID=67316 RepID=UPI003F4D4331
MQFHHAHAFRHQIALHALENEIPGFLERWMKDGAEPVHTPSPEGRQIPVGMRSLRLTFERALRASVLGNTRFTLRRGHVDGVLSRGGRAVGLRVDGAELQADLVIDASGRNGRSWLLDASGRKSRTRPDPACGGPCGIAYVDRQYQLHPSAEPGPLLSPFGWQAEFDGYQAIIFLHERGIFSVLLVRPTGDAALANLRHEAAFNAACQAIPDLAAWTEPARSSPITPVLVGGSLFNTYRGQTGHDGQLALPGLLFAGDAVATTTPTFGRGITTTVLQVQKLLRLIDECGTEFNAIGEGFEAWCTGHIKPWVEDHIRMDEWTRRRLVGEVISPSEPLPSHIILAAAEVDLEIRAAASGFMNMTALPSELHSVEPRARAVYASGWRPQRAAGPDRGELANIVREALHGPAATR